MRKLLKRVLICFSIMLLILTGALVFERGQLRDSLIRFHVVANSDSKEDQDVKLLVRDAVILDLQNDLSNIADVNQAKKYLQDNLPKIESIANSVLEAAGFEDRVSVSLCKEAFSQREYDTFTLPSGVYEALRIVIGEGKGQNWWCVTFPSLCMPATTQGFVETASYHGLPEGLTRTLSNEDRMEVHFLMLDWIGKIENSWFLG